MKRRKGSTEILVVMLVFAAILLIVSLITSARKQLEKETHTRNRIEIMNPVRIFEKEYDDESLYDLAEDVGDAINSNPKYDKLPEDENEFKEGTFMVTITWRPREE